MRIVTYARVSTKSQSDRGKSLEDQEARFIEFIKANRAERVKAYVEAKSAGTVTQRKTFSAMFEELPALDVDVLVIDSLDRFTRNMIEGPAQFVKLAEMGVKLWELEHCQTAPFDMDVIEDRIYVSAQFHAADTERERIKRRQVKRYTEARNRGATTTNNPGFGLILDDAKKRVIRDPKTAHIVEEVDRRILAGESQRKVLEWAQAMSPEAWKTRRGLQLALKDKNNAYGKAEVRSDATRRALDALKGSHRQTYGFDRANRRVSRAAEGTYPLPEHREHYLAGAIACGKCVEADIPAERAMMHGRYIIANKTNPYNVACDGRRDGKQIHPPWTATAAHVEALVDEKIARLGDNRVQAAVIAKLRYEPPRKGKKARDAQRSFDQRISEIKKRNGELDAEFRAAALYGSAEDAAIKAEAVRAMKAITAERARLDTMLEEVYAERAKLRNTAVSPQHLEDLDMAFMNVALFHDGIRINRHGESEVDLPMRELLKPFIAALGPPILDRRQSPKRRVRLVLKWPFIDTLHPPELATPYHEVRDTGVPDDVLERVEAVLYAKNPDLKAQVAARVAQMEERAKEKARR